MRSSIGGNADVKERCALVLPVSNPPERCYLRKRNLPYGRISAHRNIGKMPALTPVQHPVQNVLEKFGWRSRRYRRRCGNDRRLLIGHHRKSRSHRRNRRWRDCDYRPARRWIGSVPSKRIPVTLPVRDPRLHSRTALKSPSFCFSK